MLLLEMVDGNPHHSPFPFRTEVTLFSYLYIASVAAPAAPSSSNEHLVNRESYSPHSDAASDFLVEYMLWKETTANAKGFRNLLKNHEIARPEEGLAARIMKGAESWDTHNFLPHVGVN